MTTLSLDELRRDISASRALPDPALVRECFEENRPRLLATIATVRAAVQIGIEHRKDEK